MRHGAPVLNYGQPGTMRGSHICLHDGRLRVYGVPWQGAATSRSMEGMAGALAAARAGEDAEGVEYRLLIMHTGIEGIVPRVQGLPTMSQFQPLRTCVDYLAPGHAHKPYGTDGCIYNPCSTETWGAEEASRED